MVEAIKGKEDNTLLKRYLHFKPGTVLAFIKSLAIMNTVMFIAIIYTGSLLLILLSLGGAKNQHGEQEMQLHVQRAVLYV